jgi:hypothetical protein
MWFVVLILAWCETCGLFYCNGHVVLLPLMFSNYVQMSLVHYI